MTDKGSTVNKEGLTVKVYGYIDKATKLSTGEVDVVVSTGTTDSHGEKINVDGINLADFKKNPVVLWAHDGFNLPIARATKIWKDGGKLMARAQFYMKDEFPMKVYNYVTDGFVNAVSIGGMVDEWSNDGVTINKLTMKEFSFVPVPANPEAIVANKSFTSEQKIELDHLAKVYAIRNLTSDDELKNGVQLLKKLVASLEEVVNDETGGERANKNIHVVLRQAQAVDHQVEKVIKVVKKGASNE